MKQWIRSMMLLSVPVVVWGCKSDPTVSSGAGVAAKLVATPSRVFVNQAGSEAVTVTSVDEEGRTVPTTFTLTPPADPGITVTLDTTQQLIYNSEGVAVAPTGTATARYIVAASTFTTSSFTVTSAEGKTITIQVDATPASLPATFSKTAINLGDTITITAPPEPFRTNADTLLGLDGHLCERHQADRSERLGGQQHDSDRAWAERRRCRDDHEPGCALQQPAPVHGADDHRRHQHAGNRLGGHRLARRLRC